MSGFVAWWNRPLFPDPSDPRSRPPSFLPVLLVCCAPVIGLALLPLVVLAGEWL